MCWSYLRALFKGEKLRVDTLVIPTLRTMRQKDASLRGYLVWG